MPDSKAPGVYIDEIVATGPITGVGTSTAAFLGVAGKGPIAEPTEITNLTTFTEKFVPDGPLDEVNANLVRGVRGFFENGGTVAYVTRVGVTGVRAYVELKGGEPEKTVLKVTARRAGATGNNIKVKVERPTDAEEPRFTLVVTGPGDKQTDTYESLSMDPSDINFVGSALESAPVDVALVEPGEHTPPAKTTQPVPLQYGQDERPSDTAEAWDTALSALAKVDEVSLVCAPGISNTGIQQNLIRHCENAQDRFAILDSTQSADADAVKDQRAALGSTRGYAALYYPWLTIAHPVRRGDTLPIPPSGHVAGVFARVDTQRGVHKAPANEVINGARGLEQVLDDTQHGLLNDEGINVVRVFPGRSRPVIWGARTTSDDTAYQYVNVRRLLLFIEESIQEGIRWAVFEPNDVALWKRLDRTITEFLTRVWSSGALFGVTASEAFYVKIDEENNPPSARERGEVFVEVGIAPVRPAEFITVRIGIWAGGDQVQEG